MLLGMTVTQSRNTTTISFVLIFYTRRDIRSQSRVLVIQFSLNIWRNIEGDQLELQVRYIVDYCHANHANTSSTEQHDDLTQIVYTYIYIYVYI
jgi:hypothetical protein